MLPKLGFCVVVALHLMFIFFHNALHCRLTCIYRRYFLTNMTVLLITADDFAVAVLFVLKMILRVESVDRRILWVLLAKYKRVLAYLFAHCHFWVIPSLNYFMRLCRLFKTINGVCFWEGRKGGRLGIFEGFSIKLAEIKSLRKSHRLNLDIGAVDKRLIRFRAEDRIESCWQILNSFQFRLLILTLCAVWIDFVDLRACMNPFHSSRRSPFVHYLLALSYVRVHVGFVDFLETFKLDRVVWGLKNRAASDRHILDLDKTYSSPTTLSDGPARSKAPLAAAVFGWGSLNYGV